MSDIQQLYQELILDHGRHPRNFKSMSDPTVTKEGFNPLCGDRVTLFLKMDKNKIAAVCFQGAGCAISVASASMMTEALVGKTISDAKQLFDQFHQMVMGETLGHSDTLGKLVVLQGVCAYPARIKCATMAWHAMKDALDNI